MVAEHTIRSIDFHFSCFIFCFSLSLSLFANLIYFCDFPKPNAAFLLSLRDCDKVFIRFWFCLFSLQCNEYENLVLVEILMHTEQRLQEKKHVSGDKKGEQIEMCWFICSHFWEILQGITCGNHQCTRLRLVPVVLSVLFQLIFCSAVCF